MPETASAAASFSRTVGWLKDLNKVKRRGFPLERILVLDDTPAALARHRGNQLRAPRWTGNPKDTFLLDAIPLVKRLALEPNVRAADKGLTPRS